MSPGINRTEMKTMQATRNIDRRDSSSRRTRYLPMRNLRHIGPVIKDRQNGMWRGWGGPPAESLRKVQRSDLAAVPQRRSALEGGDRRGLRRSRARPHVGDAGLVVEIAEHILDRLLALLKVEDRPL